MSSINVVRGSVVEMSTDAIVNAANNSLLGGGGVDGAIHAAAGPGLLEECYDLGGCDTGDAKITKGYNLKAKYVIHTVGPVYHGTGKDAQLLASCYRKCMDLAYEHKLHSISICCNSTGVYGYPLQEASEIATKTVRDWLVSHADADIDVYFCCFNDREYAIYQNLKLCAYGVANKYADPSLVPKEKDAWKKAVIEKYGKN